MALPVINFQGKIGGRTIYDITKDLDYGVQDHETRVKIINDLVESNIEYFAGYFDKYYKFAPKQDDALSHDVNVVRQIEKIANYMLFSPDIKIDKKVKYNFYDDEKLFVKMQKEKSIEGIAEKLTEDVESGECLSYNENFDNVIDFLLSKTNFKKDKKQKVFESDYSDPDFDLGYKHYNFKTGELYYDDKKNTMQSYKDAIDYFSKYIRQTKEEMKDCEDFNDKTNKRKLKQSKKMEKFVKQCRDSQIMLKDKIKKTIYFKSPMADECVPDLWLINYGDPSHISALLKMPPRDLTSEIGELIYDLNKLIDECKFSEDDLKIIELYRQEDMIQSDIGEIMGVTRPSITSKIQTISKRIASQYNKNWENYIYREWLYGKYKKCSKCGEVKLFKYFGKEPKGKYGLKPYCKDCR